MKNKEQRTNTKDNHKGEITKDRGQRKNNKGQGTKDKVQRTMEYRKSPPKNIA